MSNRYCVYQCKSLCHIITLGTFSAEGMAPDPNKTQAIREWSTPGSVKAACQFWGLFHATDVTLRILLTLRPLYTS